MDGERARNAARPLGRFSSLPAAIALPAAFALLRRHAIVAAVLALYALTALVVPTRAPVAVGDDWVYARSVEILIQEHRIEIFDLSVVTLLFQVFWGALFAMFFGTSFWVLRLSTLVIVFLSAIAFYALCRELDISRSRSALGVAAYLFNPLTMVLSYTFMSDPHFTALLIITSYWYVRGLRPGSAGRQATILGSGFAALTFLVRQQGALIPFAVLLYLVVTRRLRPRREDAGRALDVVAIPAATAVLYYLWLFFVHGVPVQQRSFVQRVVEAGWGESWLLFQRLTFIEAMYVGLFVLPVAAGVLIGGNQWLRLRSPLGWVFLVGWLILVVRGLTIFAAEGRKMPYIGQFVGVNGLGPTDLQGGRPRLIEPIVADWLTGVCAVASVVFAVALGRWLVRTRGPDRGGAELLLMIGLWQVVGVLVPSYHFRNWIISVDRYLLPLLPIAIGLLLWAVRDARLVQPVAWLVVAAFAVVAVAGTRDHLVFQEATWDLAREANARGIANTKLDAGAAWDGYYLWEYSQEHGIGQQTRGGPWWTNLFGPATDSTYVVSSAPLDGYDVVEQVEYSAWLQQEPALLYLLRKQGVPGPP
ncbi:MAG: ArnT family glycosyltransferase [Thermomicrobiales bacterium]